MINKLTAHLLAGHEFKIVDKEGQEYQIDCVANDGITLVREGIDYNISMDSNQIGSDFFVLCRHLKDLTKEVNGVVPYLELGKLISKEQWYLYKDIHGDVIGVRDEKGLVLQHFEKLIFTAWDKQKPLFFNQEALFNKLYSLHFKPSSLPDECCRFIEG